MDQNASEACASGEIGIDLDRLPRRADGFWHDVLGPAVTVHAEHSVTVGEPAVRQRIVGIPRNGFGEMFDAFRQAVRGPLVPEIAALEITLIGAGALRVVFPELFDLLARELEPQRFGNIPPDLLFHLENIGQLPVEPLSPDLRAVGCPSQLRRDCRCSPRCVQAGRSERHRRLNRAPPPDSRRLSLYIGRRHFGPPRAIVEAGSSC